MTRGELLASALNVLGNGEAYRARACDWLNDALRDLENFGDWVFLRGTTTLTLTSGATSYLFSASVWPAAALTTYSKGMKLFTSTGKPLKRFRDAPGLSAEEAYGEMKGLAMTAVNPPTHFICYDTPGAAGGVEIMPTPTTTPGTLTASFVKQATFPTQDANDLLTTSGIPPKMQAHLINYIRHRLYNQIGEAELSIKELSIWAEAKRRLWAEENMGAGVAAAGTQQGGNQ